MKLSVFKKKWNKATTDNRRLELLHKLLEGVSISINSGTPDDHMYRITRWDAPPKTIDKVSYPPPQYIQEYGRANRPSSSVLYLSAHPYSPFQELGIKCNEPFVISTWKATGKLKTIDLGSIKKDTNALFTNTHNKHTEEVFKFFREAFSKDTTNQKDYILSANIAYLLLFGTKQSPSPFDSICYPSVKSKAYRENFVVKPDSVNRAFTLVKTVFGSVTDYSDDFRYGTFVPQYRSSNISSDGVITWEETVQAPQSIRFEPPE